MSNTNQMIMAVIFRAGNLRFCIDIRQVAEILGIQLYRRDSAGQGDTEGSLLYRGCQVPVISFRKKIGMAPAPYDKNARIILFELDGSLLGIIVDCVEQIKYLDRTVLLTFPGHIDARTDIPDSYAVSEPTDEKLFLIDNNLKI